MFWLTLILAFIFGMNTGFTLGLWFRARRADHWRENNGWLDEWKQSRTLADLRNDAVRIHPKTPDLDPFGD
jgi:membrane protein DedA with SNARE-associated domain